MADVALALKTPKQSRPGSPGGSASPSINNLRQLGRGAQPPRKLLVANRGEIAIRIIRTAHELGMTTVAIYSKEDRFSAHRNKADESFLVGEGLTPVAAYLDYKNIIKIAVEHSVTMIHPGYGFLSENADFAKAVEDAGLLFVGPQPSVIDGLGDKIKARTLAIQIGVPVVPGTPGAISTYEEANDFVEKYGFPVIIKAAMGGGGRGMRVVRTAKDFKDAFAMATSEAKSAFGDGTVFVERFLDKPKHIEAQLIGDSHGNIVHLFERDCSVQRRHQKVVELAPASNISEELRTQLLADAVKIAKAVKYRNAGTCEFLVDSKGHYFIEINPRIQVEHTITEEITGIDIVAAQIQIAAGASLPELGLTQDTITKRGYAIQCRITTEDPAANFQPDTGKIEVYRSAGGNGVRLDASSGFAGAQITPHYDSLLVKCTVRGATFEIARRKMLRALVEFRIRGVKTNIPFLFRVLSHESFITNNTWTTFIDDTPQLFQLVTSQNRAQKFLAYLGDLVVNGSTIKGQMGEPGLNEEIPIPAIVDPKDETKALETSEPCTTGWRNIIVEQGPEAFAKAVRAYPGVLIMDTTWRDAHQSLIATRLRTVDMANIAKETSHALSNAYALECWGGATFDVAMRFLYEDPWERLRSLRKLVPNIPFQALVRGANAVGYTSYPDNAIYEFSRKAVENGLDIFRVFDSLNYIDNMRLGIDAAKKAGGVVEAAICYTGDVANPKKHSKYTLEYYLQFAQELVDCGIHVLAIKDMAGILKPEAATILVGALRKKFPDLPIHVHSHDTAGISVSSMLACAAAGADVVDVAIDSMSGTTSQPSMGAVCSALEQTNLGTGISHENIQALNLYWSSVRTLYSCFDANVRASDSGVFDHEMPGGQYTNLMFQSTQLGLTGRWKEVVKSYIDANLLCGDIVKVTPSSKVVGDFAQFLVANKLTRQDVIDQADKLDFPNSVVEFFQGYLGQPTGGFPEPLRSKIIRDKKRIDERPGKDMEPYDFEGTRAKLIEKYGSTITSTDVLSYCMYPKVFEEFKEFTTKYGDLSVLPTRFFLGKPPVGKEIHIAMEKGKTLIVKLIAVSPVDTSSGTRDILFELNGELRAVQVEDRSAAIETVHREKATNEPGSVGSPMSAVVVEVRVHEGQEVKAGDPICVLSAMKIEQIVSAPVSGKVQRVSVQPSDSIAQGDLVAVIQHS
ncbi:pyruvate carboxylase [Microbotryum lychnidis-dioicae p1A1 Lamole]|uniref:Pyruvate carboxylase n=2 Tax=Microbotryum lychnidis-dioicae (strain p1A1 Lamole / MvSl-1064) TaxID=683840 RepID=U5GXS3_USTV1|nr:pyruvate carboxylase [Microbotryum lychnidis-dioicae p1A1 Lamole]|eukprot:KDE09592.1 pyruvate carboxylase [Microbotryum lychnidis-dioicae p1A1 Lamole]